MFGIKRVKLTQAERGLQFRDRDFTGVLGPGAHWVVNLMPFRCQRIEVFDVNQPQLAHKDLNTIVKSGHLSREVTIVDVQDDERALLWIDGRFAGIIGPGLTAFWNVLKTVKIEVVSIDPARFEHKALRAIAQIPQSVNWLEFHTVADHETGLLYRDGKFIETLAPGLHAFWKGTGKIKVNTADRRETVLDVAGQEILTADRVTLRLNAVVTFRLTDPLKTATEVADYSQSIYREAQLALRAAVGTRELDTLLVEKEGVADELLGVLRRRGAEFGVDVLGFGIRDVILPGEMKELLNKVTEARKAAEAALIRRREETAETRHQANTARVFAGNETLLRLRELEALENVAKHGKLEVIVSEKGLADRVTKLI